MEKKKIVDKLLEMLEQKLNLKIQPTGDYLKDRRLFRGVCNQLMPMDLGDEFYKLQDELLQQELAEKGVFDVNLLSFRDKIALFKGDITTLKADAIVNAANDQFLGCFVPCHNCIDNVIMSASGFQMRNELAKLKKQKNYDSEPVKVTSGYNLPSKYVFHVAGPQIFGEVTEKDKQDLANCYLYCLDKAKEMGLKSIVFCCISTGVHSFPNELASEIAIKTVRSWLNESGYDLKVVFDVFLNIDEELYEQGLRK